MTKIGPKEQQLRALRERLPAHHKMMLDDGAPVECLRSGPPPKLKHHRPADVPLVVRKPTPPTEKEETTMPKKPSKKTSKAAAKSKARTPVKAAATTEVRAGSKLAMIAELLKRTNGCTTKDVLAATGWPSVSMPATAKAAGLTLKKEKVEGVTRYSAA